MPKLYHAVPEGLSGDILMPLNQLREVFPDLYATHEAKYKGRENLMDIKIPPLNCYWNDVLFFIAVEPRLINEEFSSRGRKFPYKEWFEIDTSLLDPNATVIYPYDGLKREFLPCSAENLSSYSNISESAIQYYDQYCHPGIFIRPLAYIPHIMYRGVLRLSDLRRFTL